MSAADAAPFLALAKAAHQRYRENVPRQVPNGGTVMAVPGNKALADAAFQEAARNLAEAHVLDPGRECPGWQDAAYANRADDLLSFYGAVLGHEGKPNPNPLSVPNPHPGTHPGP